MAFLVSPGVQVKEVDLTNVVPAVATSIGAIAGAFEKGPVSSVTTITSEEDLIKNFGKPNASNFENWYCAANFLQYTNSLRVVRAESGLVNAVASGTAILIRDTDHYQGSFAAGEASVGEWAARTAGTWGNSLGVSICATATAYEEMLTSSNQTVTEDAAGSTSIAVDDIDASGDEIHVHDIISFFSDSAGTTPVTGEDGKQYEVTAINTSTNVATIKRLDDPNGGGVHNIIPDNSFIKRRWRFYDRFDGAPGTSAWSTQNGRGTGDEIHVVVFDTTGDITGSAVDVAGERQNAIIETFANMSKNPNAKTAQGSTNYYPNVIYNQSQFVYWMDHNSSGSNWGTDTTSAYTAVDTPTDSVLASGTDDYSLTNGELKLAYDKFLDTESLDINLVLGGRGGGAAGARRGRAVKARPALSLRPNQQLSPAQPLCQYYAKHGFAVGQIRHQHRHYAGLASGLNQALGQAAFRVALQSRAGKSLVEPATKMFLMSKKSSLGH